ncbi:MAG TPA: cytidine deaminase [Negativicutes bacterium]|nr:cytidine deaminase [Negativicutes bacterium]
MKQEALMKAAMEVRSKAYVPYSKFAVGAAVETGSGRIYSGCNVENASYGLTNCAERTAIFNAVSAGESQLLRLLVVADTPDPIAPCGACRQVMREFNIQEIILYNTTGEFKIVGIAELLPYAFGPEQMKGAAVNE